MRTMLVRSFFNNHSFGSQIILGLAQLFAHLSFLYVVFYFSLTLFLWSLVIYFLMTSLGVSITAHRYLSHRSFGMPRIFEIIGSIFFSLSLQGSTIAWVAMHKEHHRFSDVQGDPHSPKGNFWKTHFLSMFYSPKIKYAVALVRDSFHERIHRLYWPMNIAFSTFLFAVGGPSWVVYMHLFPAFLCWHAIGTAKTLAHTLGYRNFKTNDESYNLPVLGYLTFGEAWHNNHHAKPAKCSFSYQRHEVDISALIIYAGIKCAGFSETWNGKQ